MIFSTSWRMGGFAFPSALLISIMVCRLNDFLNKENGSKRYMGEMSKAKCSGARKNDPLSAPLLVASVA